MEQLPRLSDLVPQRVMTLALAFLAGLAVIALLLAAHVRLGAALAGWTDDGRVAAFDLARHGTAAAWFSSFLLTLSSLASLALFAVGKRHVEDYHARYRAWAWAGIVFLVMSVDSVAGLRQGFRELMSHLSGTRLAGDGSVWWAAGYGLVLLPLSWMIWHRTQRSQAARCFFLASAAAFTLAALCQGNWLPRLDPQASVLIQAAGEMLGALCLLLGLVVHAGFSLKQLGEVKRGRRKPSAAAPKPAAKKKAAPKKPSTRASRSKAAKAAAEVEESSEEETPSEESAEDEAETEVEAESEDASAEEAAAEEAAPTAPARSNRRDAASSGRGGPPAPHLSGRNGGNAPARGDEAKGSASHPAIGTTAAAASIGGDGEGEEGSDEESTRYLRVDDAEDLLEDGGGGHASRNKKKEKRRQRR